MSTTRARWPALLGALLALGCGPDPVERVTGVWEVDADALVDDPRVAVVAFGECAGISPRVERLRRDEHLLESEPPLG